jgi:Ca-activated chloride channel homolog
MSFQAPLFLAGLAIVPIALAALLLARRRPAKYVVRFPAAATLAAVMPKSSKIRRNVPPALLLTALAAMTVALARPEATIAVPVEKASVMLVTDESGSMSATDVDPSRLTAAQSAANAFLKKAPKSLLVGFVGFSSQTNAVVEPTLDRSQVRSALDSLQADGGTASGDALGAAIDRLAARRGKDGKTAPAAVILLSDGARTEGSDPLAAAQRAKQLGITVSTVALGTADGTVNGPQGQVLSVPPDPATLQEISRVTGGTFTETADAGRLEGVYKKLGSKIGTKRVKREVSSSFAAAGLVLLLGGLGTGLRWRGRLP